MMGERVLVVMMAVVLCAAMAQAGIRADLSGDAVVDFQTTMDMPFMTVGNPGNAGDTRYDPAGNGSVSYTYDIGKFEVTTGQYVQFLNAVASTDTYGLFYEDVLSSEGNEIVRDGPAGSYTYSISADREERPMSVVSWGDAARFCNWMTNGMPTGVQDTTTTEDGSYALNGAVTDAALMAVTRRADAVYVIPSEDEWYKAAYHKNDPGAPGGNYFNYPTSTDDIPGNDVSDPDSGNNVLVFDGVWPVYPYWRTEVGEFENSLSRYGTFDQGGNVWEWNEQAVGEGRSVRGGSWKNFIVGPDSNILHASYRRSYYPSFEMGPIGFRVAQVPEPATLSLLALGGLAMLLLRKS